MTSFLRKSIVDGKYAQYKWVLEYPKIERKCTKVKRKYLKNVKIEKKNNYEFKSMILLIRHRNINFVLDLLFTYALNYIIEYCIANAS